MKQATLVILLLLGVLLPTAIASGSFAGSPTLRLADRSPVTVRGLGFAAGERVSVALAAGTRSVRTTQVSANGTFVVRFSVSLGRCTRYTVQAFGSTGTRARLSSRRALACISVNKPRPGGLKPGVGAETGHD
jgi:hypothetical protein